MDTRNRNILLLGILGIVVLILLSYFLLLGPLFTRLSQGAEERDTKEAQLAELEAEVQRLEGVRRNAPELERELLELSKRIPDQPEIPTLVVQIEEVAQAAGVTQLLIQPGEPGSAEGGGAYSVVPITMTFEGTYVQMQEFLRRTQNLVRLVTVNGVTYESVEAGAGEEDLGAVGVERVLTVEVEAEVYFQPARAPIGPAIEEPGALNQEGTTTEGTTP